MITVVLYRKSFETTLLQRRKLRPEKSEGRTWTHTEFYDQHRLLSPSLNFHSKSSLPQLQHRAFTEPLQGLSARTPQEGGGKPWPWRAARGAAGPRFPRPCSGGAAGRPESYARGGTESTSKGTPENRTLRGCLARGCRHSPAVLVTQISSVPEMEAAIRPIGAELSSSSCAGRHAPWFGGN